VELYKLPNHSWLPAEWYPPGSQFDTPAIVVRRGAGMVLIRNSSWEQAKQPRFDYSKKFCGENRPNDTWKSFDLYPEPQTIQELSQLVPLNIRRKKDKSMIANPKRKTPAF
jgi:hypothetical protein